jgi:WD40 repeat protein
VWLLDGTPEATAFKGHEGGVLSVVFSPKGDRIVSGGEDGVVRLWHLDGTPAASPFKSHNGWIQSLAFSPKGDRIVSGGTDGIVRLWQLNGTPAAAPFKGHDSKAFQLWAGVSCVAFSPDGDRIASGGWDDGTVRIWQLDGTPVAAFRGRQEGGIRSVAFSPKGDRIVSAGSDGTVQVRDAASGKELLVLRGQTASGRFTAFSLDVARSVSFSTQERTIRVTWLPHSKQELIAAARARLPRELNEEEKRRFHLTMR